MTRVLVTAATGTVGQHVVTELADSDAALRIATRDPASARGRFEASVGGDDTECVEFDFVRPETWGPTLEGVDAVFLVRPPGVSVDRLGEFVEAAARVGVSHVAYLSTLGADRNVLIPHHRIEKRVRRSGVAWTFLRASFFAQNLQEVHAQDLRERDEVFVPAGSGATSFVDARDVAAVAALVLTESGHENVAYDLTGPEALTYDEVAGVFTEVLGRPITYADPSIPAFVRRMYARGHPLGYVLLMVGIYTTARLGLAGRVSDDVERLLGREPRSIREYVVDYADRFRPEGASEKASAGAVADGGGDAATTSGDASEGDETSAGDPGDGSCDDRHRISRGNPPPDPVIRVVNPVLKRLLRSPLHRIVSDQLLLLTVTGRRTGNEYTFPVGYERRGVTLYVTTHGTNWWKNLRDGGGKVSVVLRGSRRTGHAELVEENGAVAEYLQGYLRREGLGVARRSGLKIEGETVPEVEALRDAVDHVVLVRIHLNDG